MTGLCWCCEKNCWALWTPRCDSGHTSLNTSVLVTPLNHPFDQMDPLCIQLDKAPDGPLALGSTNVLSLGSWGVSTADYRFHYWHNMPLHKESHTWDQSIVAPLEADFDPLELDFANSDQPPCFRQAGGSTKRNRVSTVYESGYDGSDIEISYDSLLFGNRFGGPFAASWGVSLKLNKTKVVGGFEAYHPQTGVRQPAEMLIVYNDSVGPNPTSVTAATLAEMVYNNPTRPTGSHGSPAADAADPDIRMMTPYLYRGDHRHIIDEEDWPYSLQLLPGPFAPTTTTGSFGSIGVPDYRGPGNPRPPFRAGWNFFDKITITESISVSGLNWTFTSGAIDAQASIGASLGMIRREQLLQDVEFVSETFGDPPVNPPVAWGPTTPTFSKDHVLTLRANDGGPRWLDLSDPVNAALLVPYERVPGSQECGFFQYYFALTERNLFNATVRASIEAANRPLDILQSYNANGVLGTAARTKGGGGYRYPAFEGQQTFRFSYANNEGIGSISDPNFVVSNGNTLLTDTIRWASNVGWANQYDIYDDHRPDIKWKRDGEQCVDGGDTISDQSEGDGFGSGSSTDSFSMVGSCWFPDRNSSFVGGSPTGVNVFTGPIGTVPYFDFDLEPGVICRTACPEHSG